ncbi:MAG: hypothetical protein LUC32_07010 [Clostridiales bacterium]|nr:hypothetical protein [Clostridiales bacterium]
MDKYEYKLKLDQLKALVEAQDYETAAEIAGSINWRKVRNSKTLLMVADVYERLERYEECKEVLLQAYDHSSVGRSIVSRLAEVAVKSKNVQEAETYYQEFLEISPRDNQRYVIAYEISCLKNDPISDRIAILEELKEKEYTEIWAYELAALYSQADMREKCVETCDELVLWFGEGEYVEKALDLKRSFQPLTPAQEEKYQSFRSRKGMVEINIPKKVEAKISEDSGLPELTVTASKFNTVNLQEELAKSMQQIMDATEKETVRDSMDNIKKIVNDIPYLSGEPEEEAAPVLDREKISETVDETLKADFQELLEEESDGQIGLQIPEEEAKEQQIAGQMSIEEVLAEWEKTKHAAETAIAAAEQKKLDMEKEQALAEANEIMDRLKALFPVLSAMPGEDLPEEPDTVGATLIPEETAQPEPEKEAGSETEAPAEDAPAAEGSAPEADSAVNEDASEETEAIADEMDLLAAEISSMMAAEGLEEQPEETAAQDSELSADEQEEGADDAETGQEDDSNEDILPEIALPEDLLDEAVAGEEEPETTDEPAPRTLTDAEMKELFTYFLPVPGMQEQITQVIENAANYKSNAITSLRGNLIIQGEEGSGKTVLATSLIRAIQKVTGKEDKKIGKISAQSLNKKDFSALVPKIEGGYLIIDKAGDLTAETAVRMSQVMERNTRGMVVILEDDSAGIKKAMGLDFSFAKKFTEKVKIPVFTIDELVDFGKAYAVEMECMIDEMGVLAMYNRINNIQKLERPTTLTEVKEIVDQAIESAESGGIKKIFAKKYNENDYLILRETDFE